MAPSKLQWMCCLVPACSWPHCKFRFGRNCFQFLTSCCRRNCDRGPELNVHCVGAWTITHLSRDLGIIDIKLINVSIIWAAVTSSPLHTIKCCSVVFGATYWGFLSYTSESSPVKNKLRRSPATSVINSLVCRGQMYCTSRFLPTQPAFDAPVREGGRRHIAIPFGAEKIEWLGYPMVKTFWRYVYSFWHNSRTWRTHRHTDTAWRQRSRLMLASRGKNHRSLVQICTRPVSGINSLIHSVSLASHVSTHLLIHLSLVSLSLLSSPLSSSITPSLFHSRLKTYLFNKSFPP